MRRKESGLDVVASLPWPIGLALGLIAFAVIRYGLPAYLLHRPDPILRGIGRGLEKGPLTVLAWLVMLGCWVAAWVSFRRSGQRKQLLETRTGVDSLASLSWREFEMLVGEAYRRQGYQVEETGLLGGGADGGVDLILRRAGTKELVQCKQWRSRQVNAPRVREMWGLVDHFDADGVKIVCIGEFTRDARKFAEGKRIELVNGAELLDLVRTVQSPHGVGRPESGTGPQTEPCASGPTCPRCGESMLRRHNRSTGQAFWLQVSRLQGHATVGRGTRMTDVEALSRNRVNPACFPLVRMVVGLLMLGAAAGCAQQQEPDARRPQQAGQPLNSVETAARFATIQGQAILGDKEGLQQTMEAFHKDTMRSMKIPDARRGIDHEQARVAARSVEGVRSVAWVDRENLLVIVERNEHRTQQTIDAICMSLEPLGDTLGVVVNLQSGAATTGDDLEILSRNCQLAPGDRALLQRNRQIDVIDPEVRAQHKSAQATSLQRDREKEQEEAMRILEQTTPEM